MSRSAVKTSEPSGTRTKKIGGLEKRGPYGSMPLMLTISWCSCQKYRSRARSCSLSASRKGDGSLNLSVLPACVRCYGSLMCFAV